MKTKYLITGVVLGITLPLASLAETGQSGGTSSAAQWLNLQREQSMASTQTQAASALAREKAMERLFKTYDQPIPDKYFAGSFKATQ